MADVATSASGAAPLAAKPSTSKKTVKAKKPSLPAEHPKYGEMISSAIGHLKERKGSSRQAILKYILANFKVGTELGKINAWVKMALRAGIKNGTLRQIKGSGASGSFRLGERPRTAKPRTTQKPKPAAASKKPAAKKASKTAIKKKLGTAIKKKPGTATIKKAGAKKSKSAAAKPKKSSAKLAGKKTLKAKVAKSPAKKVAKKTAAKSPKKMVKKSPAKKFGKGKVSKK